MEVVKWMMAEKPWLEGRDARFVFYHGDCRDVIPTLERPNIIMMDPPYGIGLTAHGENRGVSSPICGDDTTDLAEWIIAKAKEWSVPLCTFCSPDRPFPGQWRNRLVWDKGGAVGGGGDTVRCWKRTWEMILISGNGPLREHRDVSVLRFPVRRDEYRHHPAQKPVDLLRYLIRQLTDPDQLILDPCMGSGSLAVAASMEGRRYIGIEIDEQYVTAARGRLFRVWYREPPLPLNL